LYPAPESRILYNSAGRWLAFFLFVSTSVVEQIDIHLSPESTQLLDWHLWSA